MGEEEAVDLVSYFGREVLEGKGHCEGGITKCELSLRVSTRLVN